MQQLGLAATRLEHKFFRAPAGAPPNRSSSADLGHLMYLIASRATLTPETCDQMLALLGRQHFTALVTRFLPEFDEFIEPGETPVVAVASKSGAIRGTRNDVALVRAHGKSYVLAMMSKGSADRRFHVDNEGARVLAEASAIVYRQFVTDHPGGS